MLPFYAPLERLPLTTSSSSGATIVANFWSFFILSFGFGFYPVFLLQKQCILIIKRMQKQWRLWACLTFACLASPSICQGESTKTWTDLVTIDQVNVCEFSFCKLFLPLSLWVTLYVPCFAIEWIRIWTGKASPCINFLLPALLSFDIRLIHTIHRVKRMHIMVFQKKHIFSTTNLG